MGDHIFICYAREDEDFVLRLAANLKQRGVPVWLDQWNIPPSADWDLAIDDALYDCARFLIILTPAAVASPEVRGELRTALDENKPILPVLYQACRIPRQLRLIQHIDFTSSGPDDHILLGQVLRALGVPIPGTETSEVSETSEVLPRLLARQPFEPEIILIPAGEFLMGSDPTKDKDARDDEQPQHTLYLPDYYLAKTPVTNAQYAAFVQATGHRVPNVDESWAKPYNWSGTTPPKGKEDHPVVLVSWHDAVDYCNWLAEVTSKPYCLPSEAEWEKGARGSNGRIYPWDNQWDAKRCNTVEGGKGGTTPVGAYPEGASPYDLLDIAGNVWEWTRSVFKDYPYVSGDGREDLKSGGSRVLRGGSWDYYQGYARCAFRFRGYPVSRDLSLGFRVAASPGSP
jgi:formylglycine-generating enzyme required for sulfatase activity